MTCIFCKHCYLIATRANATGAMVAELDYVTHPVEDLAEAETFYTDILKFGEPYVDTGWEGYWSTNTVFGIYLVYKDRDGIPRPNATNGYVSFWVDSVQEAYQYLQSNS